ncbi:MAG: hypothetical protein ACOH5I_05900 [Oligoflexus sp.]
MYRFIKPSCLLTYLAILQLSSACKLQPNQLRSNLQTSDAFDLIDRGSVGFKRRADPTIGDLYFSLRGPYNCRIAYWAEDLQSSPNSQSPFTMDCPEGETKINFALTGLEPGIPYTFQLSAWPQNFNPETSATAIFREGRALGDESTNHVILMRYVIPRRSAEIHSYRFEGDTSLLHIRNLYTDHYKRPIDEECTTEDIFANIPFPRHNSLDDPQGRGMHALGNVATDGYARSGAQLHPFFPTRMIQTYDSVERLQNWQFIFQWEEQTHQFELYPPGFIDELVFIGGEEGPVLANRSLGGISDTIDLVDENIQLELSTSFPSDISFIHLRVQDPFNAEQRIHCSFPADRKRYSIPTKFIKNLPAGTYDLTTIFETVQIQYRSGTPYPPWIVTSQDWVHARLNKRF